MMLWLWLFLWLQPSSKFSSSWFCLRSFLTYFIPHYFPQTPPTLWRLWLLHAFLSSLRCSQLSQSELLPSGPLNYLVARSRKIQPSSWFSNIFVSNSVHWPFSLGLGSWGLWVRENVLRILFRKRGRKKYSKYTHTSTLKDTPATLVKRIGRHLVQKEGKWVKPRFKDEVQSNQRWASSWECKVRMVTRWILSSTTTWIYEVLIFMPSRYSNGFLCQDY